VVYAILLLMMLGGLSLWLAGRRQVAAGLPSGRMVFMDTERIRRLENPLYDASLNLIGRPDYVVRRSEGLIPVEAKSSRAPFRPYPSHILQIAAYCKLVEASYQERPPYGIVKYADRAFALDFDSALENRLLDVLAEMRRKERSQPDRSHESSRRCLACGYRQICDQALE
jgi:CRISPR-associated exonuclease Cas4